MITADRGVFITNCAVILNKSALIRDVYAGMRIVETPIRGIEQMKICCIDGPCVDMKRVYEEAGKIGRIVGRPDQK